MTLLQQPQVKSLLDDLYADARRVDGPLFARYRALSPDERKALMTDYRRMFREVKDAYMPIDRAAGELLYLLARARGARRIVEFGTSFGISTIFLAAALADGSGGRGARVIGTELDPDKAVRARANLERAGLAHLVEVRVGDALETLASDVGPVDLVLLDGAKTLYRPILSLLEPSLAENALVVSDNMTMTDVVAEFAAYVRDPSNGYLACALPALGGGLEVALRLAHGRAA
jgi:predicted O-methyltransferase YrrM